MKQCRNLGLDVVAKESFEVDSPELETLFQEIVAIAPDLVYMISNAMEGSILMGKAKETGLNPKVFMGNPSGFASSAFGIVAGDVSAFVYAPVIWVPSVPYADAGRFSDTFIQKYEVGADYHAAQAYAAMYVISDALKRADSLTPKGVRDALATTDMMTVLGRVRFVSYRKKSQQNRLPTYLVQWINGELVTVWPRKFAESNYIFPTPTWDERF